MAGHFWSNPGIFWNCSCWEKVSPDSDNIHLWNTPLGLVRVSKLLSPSLRKWMTSKSIQLCCHLHKLMTRPVILPTEQLALYWKQNGPLPAYNTQKFLIFSMLFLTNSSWQKTGELGIEVGGIRGRGEDYSSWTAQVLLWREKQCRVAARWIHFGPQGEGVVLLVLSKKKWKIPPRVSYYSWKENCLRILSKFNVTAICWEGV